MDYGVLHKTESSKWYAEPSKGSLKFLEKCDVIKQLIL